MKKTSKKELSNSDIEQGVLNSLENIIYLNNQDVVACIDYSEINNAEVVEKIFSENGEEKIFTLKEKFKLDDERLKLVMLRKLEKGEIYIKNGDLTSETIKFLRRKLKNSQQSVYYLCIDKDGKMEIEEYCTRENKKDRNDSFEFYEELKDIVLSDIEDFVCDSPILAGYIKEVVANHTESAPNFNRNIANIEFGEKTLYTDELIEKTKKFSHMMNFNKLMLIIAYRKIEILENYFMFNNKELTKEKIEVERQKLQEIYNVLKRKKGSISAEGFDRLTKGRKQIAFTVSDVENALKRFIGNDYYSEEKQNDIRKGLLENDIKLENIGKEVFDLISLTEEQVLSIIKNSEQNFRWYVDNKNISNSDIVTTFKMYDNPSSDLIEFLISKVNKKFIVELYNDGTIAGTKLVELKERVNIEELFNVSGLLENEQSSETIFKLVNDNLLSKDKVKKYITDDTLKGKVENDDIDLILKLFEFDLVSLGKIREYINDDTIIREFENENQDINKLLRLYADGIITDEAVNLLIDEYKLDGKIVDSYINDDIIDYKKVKELDININLEEIELIIKQEQEKILKNETKRRDEDKEEINEEKLSKAKTLIAYMIEKEQVSEEKLDQLYKEGIITEEDLFEFAQKGYFSEDVISSLYNNFLISEEELNKLKDLNIISEEKTKEAIKNLNIERIKDDVKIALGIYIPDFKREDTEKNSYDTFEYQENSGAVKSKERKVVIHPVARDAFIKGLGGHELERIGMDIGDEKSPFYHYKFYVIADSEEDITPDNIIIAERYYVDSLSDEKKLATENATYMFRFKDLARIGKKSKREVNDIMINGTDENVLRTNHIIKTSKERPRGWAKLLRERVNKWKKGKKYRTAKSDEWLDTLADNIDGVEEIEAGKWTRIFDVYSDTGETYYGEDR